MEDLGGLGGGAGKERMHPSVGLLPSPPSVFMIRVGMNAHPTDEATGSRQQPPSRESSRSLPVFATASPRRLP